MRMESVSIKNFTSTFNAKSTIQGVRASARWCGVERDGGVIGREGYSNNGIEKVITGTRCTAINKDTGARQRSAGNAYGGIKIFTHNPGEQIESILFIATPSTGDIELTGEEEDSYGINHDAFEDAKAMPAPISDDASKRELPFVVLYTRYRRRQF
ncbi:6062_t:CDS:2 [Paraglomus brasilianum]|uniref:6062_t:CDS:1 n=1 Tax=Paraglomus brasilianum TaxID=144538 RepID=A0A9N9CVP6_9GLOM|nr:6062_t:CDS:2 [Paraglomus brasilianum]